MKARFISYLLTLIAGAGLGSFWTVQVLSVAAPRNHEEHPATQPPVQRLTEALPDGLRALSGLHAFAEHQQIPGAWRNWTDVDGRTVEARLLRRGRLTVQLETRTDRRTYSVPIERLSPADRAWVNWQDVTP